MTWWAAAANAAIAVAYMAIFLAIMRPLAREGQFPSNRLASATAAIFFSCSVGHALHAGALAVAAGHPIGSWAGAQAAWDGLTAGVGVYYWTLRRSYPGLLDGGRLFEDLRERQRRDLAEATRDSERRYRGVFDQAIAGMAIMDVDGTVQRVNAALCRLLDRDEADLLGRSLVDLAHPDDAERDAEDVRRVLTGEADGLHGQRRLLRADGGVVHAAISASLVRDEVGWPEQFVAQVVDVTALVEGQRALRDSEEQFRSVFDNALVGMALTAPDGRLLRVNAAMARMLGYRAEELVARSWPEITHPDDVDESARLVRACLAGELSGFTAEKRYLHADGHVVTVSLATSLVRGADRLPRHFATQMTDISARRVLEEQLRERHHQYERLLEGLSELGEGVALDDGGRIVYVNDALCRLTGYDRGELLAMGSAEELVASAEAEDTRPVEGGGSLSRGTLALRRRDGAVVPMEFASIPIRLRGGMHRLSVLRDVSERVRSNVELQAANQLKTDLLAMLSHDIGQPLTAIRGYAQLLVHKWPDTTDEMRLMMLGRMRDSAERLGAMVSQILAMGRAEGPALVAEPQPVAMAAAVDQALAPLIDTVQGVFVAEAGPATALVDPGHLQQILVNLVSNAGKYGRPPIEVSAWETGDGQVELRIRDHGSGIPEEFVPRLFERYTRAGTGEALGTGLGLFIVRRLVEANGGQVRLDQAVSPGACFVVTLPAAASGDRTALPEESQARGR